MKPSLSSIMATGSDVRVPQWTSSSKEMLEKQLERIKKRSESSRKSLKGLETGETLKREITKLRQDSM